MTTPDNNEKLPSPEAEAPSASETVAPLNPEAETANKEGRRRILLFILILLLLCCCVVGGLFAYYMVKPQPLPQLLPQAVAPLCYKPSFKTNITGIAQPMGVAVSPDSQRIYVTEGAGDHLVKMFDRNGNLINQFGLPGAPKNTFFPTYIAVESDERVFVVDSWNVTIDIFDKDGKFLDAIIAEDMTLSKALSQGGVSLDGLSITFFDRRNGRINYQTGGSGTAGSFSIGAFDGSKLWHVNGIRFDHQNNLLYTDLKSDQHSVHIVPSAALNDLTHFAPTIKQFGVQGALAGQFDFPQVAVVDSKGNYYISDGNNSRVSTWDANLKYRSFFGYGGNDGLSAPRGAWMDPKDCLLVADSVGQSIQVYNVSGAEAVYATSFGDFGVSDGLFAFPNDVTVDETGRLYIADTRNNRVQVWSY